MAAKRPIIKAIEWTKIAERVSDAQKSKFVAFRVKSDGYLRRVSANPENAPKLDWAYYKKNVPIPGLVDAFQKQYESLQIPVPADTLTSTIDSQEKEIRDAVAKFKAESDERIVKMKAEVTRIQGLLPYEQMTMEDFAEAHPEEALDPINRPTLWPHEPEDQIGYKPDDKGAH
ncbi:ATP synthase [Nesidiocoris tenuis]|uniref:ATP synthase subunit d, mitochondrial n=1 Tax=Nesidiocoris tenuis TaxID=355587 RepID=A0ABN7BID5_9HEMI|nr:ATP synthase [Nesidiocoris tenuis]